MNTQETGSATDTTASISKRRLFSIGGIVGGLVTGFYVGLGIGYLAGGADSGYQREQNRDLYNWQRNRAETLAVRAQMCMTLADSLSELTMYLPSSRDDVRKRVEGARTEFRFAGDRAKKALEVNNFTTRKAIEEMLHDAEGGIQTGIERIDKAKVTLGQATQVPHSNYVGMLGIACYGIDSWP